MIIPSHQAVASENQHVVELGRRVVLGDVLFEAQTWRNADDHSILCLAPQAVARGKPEQAPVITTQPLRATARPSWCALSMCSRLMSPAHHADLQGHPRPAGSFARPPVEFTADSLDNSSLLRSIADETTHLFFGPVIAVLFTLGRSWLSAP